jgi:hypothetical protein
MPVPARTKQKMFPPASFAPGPHRPHLLATTSPDRTKRFPLKWRRRTTRQIRLANRADDVAQMHHDPRLPRKSSFSEGVGGGVAAQRLPSNGLEVNPRGQGPRAEAAAARRLPAFEARDAGGVTPFKYR